MTREEADKVLDAVPDVVSWQRVSDATTQGWHMTHGVICRAADLPAVKEALGNRLLYSLEDEGRDYYLVK